jgi:tRNA threonylcarbamoyladenosine biosynthesis protein TsaE
MSGDVVTLDLAADPACTERLGEALGSRLRPGDVVALVGPMGAGKTTLARGVARGLQIDDPDAVASPTYLLVVEHSGATPLVHADAYLPEKLSQFLEDGGLEYLFDEQKVVLVEWADKIPKLLPESVLWVNMGHRESGGRSVHMRAGSAGAFPWLTEIRTIFQGD